jgi:hypothetical protein
MPIRAIAYHPRVATAKLQMYSPSETAGTPASDDEKSVGEGIRCAKCGLTFAVVFPIQDNLGNNAYRMRLKRLIRDDCKHSKYGRHKDEYLIDDTR